MFKKTLDLAQARSCPVNTPFRQRHTAQRAALVLLGVQPGSGLDQVAATDDAQQTRLGRAGHYRQALDAALRQRVVDGEQEAFAGLMRRYNRRLYRVARSILRDDAEAEDALQDAYIQAYRALPGAGGRCCARGRASITSAPCTR